MASIYEAIGAVMRDIGAISKDDLNTYDKYKFRGIDAVYNAVQPALVKNGVFIVPRLASLEQSDRLSKKGETQIHSRVEVDYTLFASDVTSIEARFPGEAVDRSDKSINKAMTAAYKYMIFELFCIPTEDLSDADAESIAVGVRKETNREKLMQFCQKRGISMKEVADRFGLDRGTAEDRFADALNTLMDEYTPKG